MKIKAKVIGSGTDEDSYRVDLPAYSMVDGTEVYVGKKLVEVEVIVPDDECDEKGLNKTKIRGKYKGQRWDNENVADDVAVTP